MTYYSTKTFEHLGSAAFRQWRADSHCKYLHGYAFTIKIIFGSGDLDATNWVVDFGSLKTLKKALEDMFDHKTVVAEDDPQIDWFVEAEKRGIIDLYIVPSTGCEKFAEYIFNAAQSFLAVNNLKSRVWVSSVEISEHGGNSALYARPPETFRKSEPELNTIDEHTQFIRDHY